MEHYQELWKSLTEKLTAQFGNVVDLTEALYLIGVQELGQGFREFSKQEKMDLIHIGNCKALSYAGFYLLTDFDDEKWPIYEKVKEMPSLQLKDQEAMIKKGIIEYFLEMGFIEEGLASNTK